MDEQEKQFIKSQLEGYLRSLAINPRRKFTCLNPEHTDHHPSMSYDLHRQKVRCFSCGVDYDIFDIIGKKYDLTDMKAIFVKARELFSCSLGNSPGSPASHDQKSRPRASSRATEGNSQGDTDYSAYFLEVRKHIGETDYPQGRGFSEQTIADAGLGYDSDFKFHGKNWKALIIPISKGCFVARNTDERADPKDRYCNVGRPLKVFNSGALWRSDSPVFVVEGAIDALSVIEAGGEAIALNGVANNKPLLALLKDRPPTQPLLVAMDKDAAGNEKGDKLLEAIEAFNVSCAKANIVGKYKDPNEFLVANREVFVTAVQEVTESAEAERDIKWQEYLNTSVAAHIGSFMSGIAESVNTPSFPTGFSILDECLDGGLYEGLYVVGGVSSLGKTTLVLQIADQLAQRGQDVLIFSLEMARTELMAKSISRHTILGVLKNEGKNMENAMTTRGITDGSRYKNYSYSKKKLINEAIGDYETYANHLFIHEAIGNIGTKQVREQVGKHFSVTGQYPVVVIDYLQILVSCNDRATDKQNTDAAVMELKKISRDCKTPVISLSSFNRANYSQPVKMAAFKESGAIEYSSDVLIGLQLEGVGSSGFDVDTAMAGNPREIELVILKNRNGVPGKKVAFAYYPRFNFFEEKGRYKS